MRSSRPDLSEKVRAQFGGRDPLFGTVGRGPRLLELRLDAIRPNPDQPRRRFDEPALDELAASIERHGLVQPVTVKRLPEGDGYVLVAGERRYRAVRKLGRETIAAILTDGDADEIALIENLQREDLRPLEQAEALARLMARHRYNRTQLAEVIGKARTTVLELLRLNDLPEEIKAECRTSDTPKSVLVEIARARDPDAQRALWREHRAGGRTVRAVRAAKRGEGAASAPTLTGPAKALAAARSLLRRLQELEPGELAADRDRYEELLRVKTAIDAVLGPPPATTGEAAA